MHEKRLTGAGANPDQFFREQLALLPRPGDGRRGLRVLLVYPDDLLRRAHADGLADDGHEIREAVDTQSATLLLRDAQEPFEVVIVDCELPDASDLEWLLVVRHVSPASRVILVTGFMTPQLPGRAHRLGAWQVVNKPINLRIFRKLLLTLDQSTSRQCRRGPIPVARVLNGD